MGNQNKLVLYSFEFGTECWAFFVFLSIVGSFVVGYINVSLPIVPIER